MRGRGDSGRSTGLRVLWLVLALATPARGQESLEVFVERVVTAQLERSRIAGATVAVVKDGQVVLARGYGQADAEHATPVDPERTLFRVASVGKLLLWTAVMQLVEQGRLDLKADLNTYLEEELRLPATFPSPLSLEHLMSHTPGLEVPERLWPAGPTPDSLSEYLQRRRPARVREAGTLPAYSDYGASLAEHIVERVSGVPFGQYLREHVQAPLGMNGLFGRSVPPERVGDVALGHTLEGGHFRAWPLEEVVVASSGSLLASATDMARFMLAHLGGGQLGGHRILRPDTVERMHRQHFTVDSRLSGWAHGFMEFHLQGQTLLGHTGDAYRFHSLLVLLPGRSWGLFVSYNGLGEQAGAQRARMELLQALLERDFPTGKGSDGLAPPGGLRSPAEPFVGNYQTTWRAYTTAEASLGWLQEVRVRSGEDGTLRIQEPGKAPRVWVEVEPHFFRPTESPGSSERLAFQEDGHGHITRLAFENQPTAVYERVAWYEASVFTRGLLAGCALTFLLAVGMGGIRREGTAVGFAVIGLLHLLFLAGFVFLVRRGAGLEEHEALWLSRVARGCALMGTLLLPGVVTWLVRRGWRHSSEWPMRVYLIGITLTATAFSLWLRHWHVL